jgi:tellurite resistance protein
MSLMTRLKDRLQRLQLTGLEPEEKRALLSLMHVIITVDDELSVAELSELTKLEDKLGVGFDELLAAPEAVAVLARSPRTMKLACLMVADAFFVDGDYDAGEKVFVENFATRFGLSDNPLRAAVEQLRTRKMDDALADWNHEINKH